VYGCTVRRSIADANKSCNAAHWTGVSRASRSRTRVDLLGDEQPPIAPAQQDIGIVGDTVADDQRHHRIGIAVGRSGIGRRGGAGPTRSGHRGTARSLERRIAGEVRLEQVGRHDGVTVDLVLLCHHFQKPRQQRAALVHHAIGREPELLGIARGTDCVGARLGLTDNSTRSSQAHDHATLGRLHVKPAYVHRPS
jgi:hypothetical protein